MSLMHRRQFYCCTVVAFLGAAIAVGGGGCAATGSDTEETSIGAATVTTGTGGTGGSGGADAVSTVTSSVSSSVSSSASSGSGGAGPVCGNGVQEQGEACDSSDFAGKTCQDYGLAAGMLQCNAFCGVVVSGCTPLENCSNGDDDDKDGDTDCADSECSAVPSCTDSCAAPYLLGDGDFDFQDTTGRPDVLKGSCTTESGPELVYAYTATANVDVVVALYFSDADMSLSVRTACGDAETQVACTNAVGPFDFEDETIAFKATKSMTYYIVVDGVSPTDYGAFGIELTEVFPETSCNDNFDDDSDGFIDCADPLSCQPSLDCVPGVKGVGTSCTDHTDCAATGNDPVCINEMDYNWPSGYCSEYCDLLANDCALGSVCAEPSVLGKPFKKNGLGVCFKTCTKKADCSAGYMCSDFGAGFVCKL